MNPRILLLSLLVGLFILIAVSVFIVSTTKPEVTNFEECVSAGYPVLESYPRRCNVNGQSFTEQISLPPSGISPLPPDNGVVCTLDAKICPDGSAVGRTGPNCEFAPCP